MSPVIIAPIGGRGIPASGFRERNRRSHSNDRPRGKSFGQCEHYRYVPCPHRYSADIAGALADIMNPAMSAYLNLVRGSAAITVLAGHAGWRKISGGLSWQVRDYGQDAVTVFFVLSGFVITLVTGHRETGLATYVSHRAAPI